MNEQNKTTLIAAIIAFIIAGVLSGAIHNVVKANKAEQEAARVAAEQAQAAPKQVQLDNAVYLARLVMEYGEMEAERATRPPMDFCNASLLIVHACQDDGCSARWSAISRRDCEIASAHHEGNNEAQNR